MKTLKNFILENKGSEECYINESIKPQVEAELIPYNSKIVPKDKKVKLTLNKYKFDDEKRADKESRKYLKAITEQISIYDKVNYIINLNLKGGAFENLNVIWFPNSDEIWISEDPRDVYLQGHLEESYQDIVAAVINNYTKNFAKPAILKNPYQLYFDILLYCERLIGVKPWSGPKIS